MIFKEKPNDFHSDIEVVGCFLEHEGKILLLRRQTHKFQGNLWGVPGGKLERHETPMAAAIRETLEETGFDISRQDIVSLGKVYVKYPDADYIYHMVKCRPTEHPQDVRIAFTEHTGFAWVTPNDALTMPLMLDEDACIKLVYGQRIKAVLFDCDGTLVDSEHTHYTALQLALQEMGHDLSMQDYTSYVGQGVAIFSKLLAQKIGIDALDVLFHKLRAHYRGLCLTGVPPIAPTVQFLHALAKEKSRLGIKVGLCSASHKEDIVAHLRSLGVEHLFDIILSGENDLEDYSDPEGVNKPKPYIYLHAAKTLGLAPDECVVIEDSHPGVTAGVNAGCVTIAVPNHYTQHQDLSHAHVKLASFSSVGVEEFLKMVSGCLE